MSTFNFNFRSAVFKRIGKSALPYHFQITILRFRHPATQNNYFRSKNRNKVSQAYSYKPGIFFYYFYGNRRVSVTQLKYFPAGHRILILNIVCMDFFLVSFHYCRRRSELLIRPSYPFITGGIVEINNHLSYFSSCIVHTPVKLAVYDYSSTDSRTKSNKYYIGITLRCPESMLCYCHHIGIIANIRRKASLLVAYFCKRHFGPAFDSLVGTYNYSRHMVNKSFGGNTNTDWIHTFNGD